MRHAGCAATLCAAATQAGAQPLPATPSSTPPGATGTGLRAPGWPQGPGPAPMPAPPPAPASPPPAPQADTVLAHAAREIGIRRCYAAINVVSARTFAGAGHADVVLDWDRQAPDDAPFFSLTGLDFAHAAAVLSLTTVPQPAGCTVLAERISSAPLACRELARTELAGYRASPLVPAVTVYTSPGRARETVTLIEAPPSCVIVRREVRFAGAGGP